jgi:hypothetical protein
MPITSQDVKTRTVSRLQVDPSLHDAISDQQIQTVAEVSHLQELNTAVLRENTRLRAQLNASLSSRQRIVELQEQNTQLNYQLRNRESQKDDISRWLDISLRQITEQQAMGSGFGRTARFRTRGPARQLSVAVGEILIAKFVSLRAKLSHFVAKFSCG